MTKLSADPIPPVERDLPTRAEESARADRAVELAFFQRDAADRAVITAFLRDSLDA